MENKRLYSRAVQATAGFALLTVLGIAQAQTTYSIGQIQSAANTGTDKSMAALQLVFGAVVTNPLSAATGSAGLVGPMFLVLNGCLLAVGVILALYHFVRMVVDTAQSGEFMGEKKKSPWYVIKNIVGFVGLVPIFGGYSGSQIVMLWATMMGVGIANLTLAAALAALQAGGSMVVTPVAGPVTTLSKGLFEAYLCSESNNQALSAAASEGAITVDPNETMTATAIPDPNQIGITLANANGISCGGASLTLPASMVGTSTSALSADGFASYTGDQSSVDSSMSSAHSAALSAMESTLQAAAAAYVTAVQNGTTPANALQTINTAAAAYQASIQSAANNLAPTLNGLSSTIQTNLTRDGWIMAGAWYQTFAQANSHASAATDLSATALSGSGSGALAYPTLYGEVMSSYQKQLSTVSSTYTPAAGSSDSNIKTLLQGSTDPKSVVTSLFPGQAIVKGVISVINGSNGTSGSVNPLIAMKNMGDYIIGTGEIAFTSYVAVKAYEGYSNNSLLGSAENGVENVATLGIAGAAKSAIFSVIDAIGPLVLLLIVALVFYGVMLSVYLPLLPFIHWFGSVVTWLVTVFEAMIAAPLWSITHLDGEADGLVGQRSAHGYIFLLNLMFRPVIMLIAYVLGGSGLEVLGTLLNTMFGTAMQNAQFSSLTGVVSIIGFIVIYVNMCVALVHQCFSLTHVIPDAVFAWVGGHASHARGDQIEAAVNRGFGSASGSAGSKAEQYADRAIQRYQQGGGEAKPNADPVGKGSHF